MNAINEIIEQEEGTGPIDPDDEGNQLAHFYKFEEILCEAFLVKNDTHYSYSGEPIRFQQDGVWPMRNNPSKKMEYVVEHMHTMKPEHSTEYTEAYLESFKRHLVGNLRR